MSINGNVVLKSTNQFRRHVVPIKEALKTGVNTIEVHFDSAVQYAAQQAAKYPFDVPHAKFQNGLDHANFVRKRPSDFGRHCMTPSSPALLGWDWGPAVAPVGIWQSIRILGSSTIRLQDVQAYVSREVDEQPDLLPPGTDWAAKSTRPLKPQDRLSVDIKLHYECVDTVSGHWTVAVDGLGTMVSDLPISCETQPQVLNFTVKVSDVKLWWPHGYGGQPLYNLSVAAVVDGQVQESAMRTIGFRDVTMDTTRSPDGGRGMFFRVNGVPIYAKGASYVPLDALNGRVTPDQYKHHMVSAIEANYWYWTPQCLLSQHCLPQCHPRLGRRRLPIG